MTSASAFSSTHTAYLASEDGQEIFYILDMNAPAPDGRCLARRPRGGSYYVETSALLDVDPLS